MALSLIQKPGESFVFPRCKPTTQFTKHNPGELCGNGRLYLVGHSAKTSS